MGITRHLKLLFHHQLAHFVLQYLHLLRGSSRQDLKYSAALQLSRLEAQLGFTGCLTKPNRYSLAGDVYLLLHTPSS